MNILKFCLISYLININLKLVYSRNIKKFDEPYHNENDDKY
jgi:hypothetical protein